MIREMTIEDYDEVYAFWSQQPGVGLTESDSRDAIEAFLQRNPGMSCVVRDDEGTLIGAVLCGHDGRRGFLHHMAVAPLHRKRGLGRTMVNFCLKRLRDAGITRCNIWVYTSNEAGHKFWRAIGYVHRADLGMMQRPTAEVV